MEPGEVFRVRYPFVRDTWTEMDMDGAIVTACWKPGTRPVPHGSLVVDAEADGTGVQILTVVSRHKPSTYPERVFYTQRWQDPDGKEFGKGTLRMTTLTKFARMVDGYAWSYRLAATAEAVIPCE